MQLSYNLFTPLLAGTAIRVPKDFGTDYLSSELMALSPMADFMKTSKPQEISETVDKKF